MASTNSTSSFTAVNDEFAHLDLNGKIIVKAEYGIDIRKIPILNDEITYDELVLMMQRLFKLQPTDEIEIKYRDEDNDLISIVDGNDLSFAIQCSRLLKLKIFVNSKSTNLTFNERREIRDELIAIRNRCINLLDKFDQAPNGEVTDANKDSEADSKESPVQKVYSDPPKELDPLNKRANSPVATLETETLPIKSEVPKNEISLGGDQVGQVKSNQIDNQQVAQQQVLQQTYPTAPQSRPLLPSQFGSLPPTPDKQVFQAPPPPFSQQGFNPMQNEPSTIARPPSSVGMPPSPFMPNTSGTGFSRPPQQQMQQQQQQQQLPPQPAKQFMPPPFAPVSMAGPFQPPTSGPMQQAQFGPPPPSGPQNMQPPPQFGGFAPPGPGGFPPMNQPGPGQDHNPSAPGMNLPPTSGPIQTGPPVSGPGPQPRTPHLPPPGAMPPPPQMLPQGGPPGGFQPQGPPQGMPPQGPPQGPPGGYLPQGPPHQGPPGGMGMPPQGPPRPMGPPPVGPPPTSLPGNPGGNPYMMPGNRMRYIPNNPYMPSGEQ